MENLRLQFNKAIHQTVKPGVYGLVNREITENSVLNIVYICSFEF